ncbi:MAG: transcription termination factor Rho [Actinobacteria bacterium]|nr:transcription termination factor Rho [Actinomycetota bacterium]
MIKKTDEALSPEASAAAAVVAKEASAKPATKPRTRKVAVAPEGTSPEVAVASVIKGSEEKPTPPARRPGRKPKAAPVEIAPIEAAPSASAPAEAAPVTPAPVTPAPVTPAPAATTTIESIPTQSTPSPEVQDATGAVKAPRRQRRTPVPIVEPAEKKSAAAAEPIVEAIAEPKMSREEAHATDRKPYKQVSKPQQQTSSSAAGKGRRSRRPSNGGHHDTAVVQTKREDLEQLKLTELREKAIEFEIDVTDLKKKEELLDAVYGATAKAEGFADFKGILDIMPEGYGFLRTSGYLPGENDVYVGQNAIRRNNLRCGDMVIGQSRSPRDNEKYPALHSIDTVNDIPLADCQKRIKFAELTPVYPNERLIMEHGKDTITARTIDLVAPIGKGQRGLIVSPPKAGKTTILKDIAAAISANNPDVHLMCLLVDERPEEVTDMQRSIKGEVISSTFDMPCENHIAVAELVLERAKRLVECGKDVVILLDSITRLARAYNLSQPASGRILSGGVDSTALYPPKRFLGAARNIEHGGSLTILASALIDTGSKMDEVIFEEFKGTGNMELKLDRNLADRRIFPAIDPVSSGTRKEELLLDPQEAPFIWGIRRILANMNNTERAMDMLIKSLKKTDDNQEFLVRTAKKAQSKNGNTLEV